MRIIYMNPNDLKFRDNVRWRADSNLNELMESMKQHGMQTPVKAREEDKTIVYGHRRVAAAIKLQLEKIPVILESGISDKEANILNLLENMQRKDVTSMEIGRQCDLILKDKKFNISLSELAVTLGTNENRVKTCLEAFRRLPEQYRSKVVHLDYSRKRKFGDLPENVVFAILNLNRFINAKLSAKEMDLIFKKTGEEKLSVSHINLLGLLINAGMPLKKAIKELDCYEIVRISFVVLKTELASAQKKEGIFSKKALFENIMRKVYPNLVY